MNTNDTTRVQRHYSDEERAKALAVLAGNAGNVSKTAAALGIPRITLMQWRDSVNMPEDVAALRERKREELAERFERLAELLLGVVEEKASEMNGRDAAVASGVALDKSLLLRGLPSAITETRGTDTPENASAREMARARYAGRRKPAAPE